MHLLAFIFSNFDSSLTPYGALFMALMLSGIGFPVPEEVTTLFGGYLAYLGVIDFRIALFVLVAGNFCGDMLGYFAGKFFGAALLEKIPRQFQHIAHLFEKGKNYFDKYGDSIVFFTRPLMGIRFVIPILAGHFRMRMAKFIFLDSLAMVPWTMFLASLSYYLGSSINLITKVREIHHAVFAAIALTIFLYALLQFIKDDAPVSENK